MCGIALLPHHRASLAPPSTNNCAFGHDFREAALTNTGRPWPDSHRKVTRIRRKDRLVCITPQTRRAVAAYPGVIFTSGSHLSTFLPALSSRNALAAAVGIGCAMVQHILADFPGNAASPYHDGNIRSAGLRTAAGPRFSTCV